MRWREIAAFLQAWPDVEVHLQERISSAVVKAVLEPSATAPWQFGALRARPSRFMIATSDSNTPPRAMRQAKPLAAIAVALSALLAFSAANAQPAAVSKQPIPSSWTGSRTL